MAGNYPGGISDQIQSRFGSRLPMITTGVTIAGLIFVVVSLLLQWQIPPEIRWIVPILMTLWVMSMVVFRGPVVALLRQAAPMAALPQANILLTVVFGLVGALSPLMTIFMNSVGGSITFILGAIVLTLGATILYSSTPRHSLFTSSESAQSVVSPLVIGILFILGLGAGLEINLVLRTFPPIIHRQLTSISTNWIVSIILLISAISVIPVAKITMKLGTKTAMRLGLLIILACLGILLFQPSGILAVGLILVVGVAFGLVFESQIPLVLGMLPSDRAGLGTGLYFGGMGAANTLVSILLQGVDSISPIAEFLWCVVSFSVVVLCLAATRKMNKICS
jgi:hypothetical protein